MMTIFIIWPSSVTLTLNRPKQMFQMALLILKENTWVKLFWNPCINIEVMARTSSIYDHFIIWPSSVTCWASKLFLIFMNQKFQFMIFTQANDHFIFWPSSMTLTFNLPEQMFLCQIILKSTHKCTSYGSDKLNLWSFYHLTFKCDLDLQVPEQLFKMTLLCINENNCTILFWNPCKCKSCSIYDHFIISPSSVTLAFNMPELIFQMAFLLVKEKVKETKCAKLFWNPWINIHHMAQKSSIYDHFIIWPSKVTLTFNLPEQWFQLALSLLKKNTYAQLLWNPCMTVVVSLNLWPFLSSDSQVWPWPSTFLNNCFKWHVSSLRTTTVPNYLEIHA